jgi:predicted nucleic-acid-binding protein
MIGIDTHILARFYCDDPDDPESIRQRPIARRIMVESDAIFVPLTVILEFEWVMRAFYETQPADFCAAIAHLLGMPHVVVERWEAVNDALEFHRRGLDFADALHWTCSAHCREFVSFEDRRFVRRARRMKRAPAVLLAR